MNNIIYKIPKPLLVLLILSFALLIIIMNNPLSNGCEVELTNFDNSVLGVLKSYRLKSKKIQYAQLDYVKERCANYNSIGACSEYFKSLKKVADSLKQISGECHEKLIESYPKLLNQMADGMKILALSAWGSQIPENMSRRLGWLSEAEVRTFCRLKLKYIDWVGVESYKQFRKLIYMEFPSSWPDVINSESKLENARPKAFKTSQNPSGALDESKVFEKSLFSIKCELYN